MTPAAIIGDLEAAQHSIRAGALLLRMVATGIRGGDAAPAEDVPRLLGFIADGMLERVQFLEHATEQLEAAPEPVGEARP